MISDRVLLLPTYRLNTSALRKFVLIPLLLLSANFAHAASWTAGGSTNQNWSEGSNWDPGVPAAYDAVYFEDQQSIGYTNIAGAINNIVDTNTTVAEVHYTAVIPASKAGTTNSHFYTTLIPN